MDQNFYYAIFVGFFAQLIDGTLGMAYGISASTFLLTIGIPPRFAIALTHTAELILTGVSGFSHFKFGNVDQVIFKKLVIPGVFGGIIGAYFLVNIPTGILKPIISAYLMVMGIVIIVRVTKKKVQKKLHPSFVPLGFFGGFFDAIGGGGWGPIVTTTLVVRGETPRMAIGSVNLAEFFVTVAESAVFLATLNLSQYWHVVIGLLIGGIFSAPLAAYLCTKISAKILTLMVGIVIILLSFRNLYLITWPF